MDNIKEKIEKLLKADDYDEIIIIIEDLRETLEIAYKNKELSPEQCDIAFEAIRGALAKHPLYKKK